MVIHNSAAKFPRFLELRVYFIYLMHIDTCHTYKKQKERFYMARNIEYTRTATSLIAAASTDEALISALHFILDHEDAAIAKAQKAVFGRNGKLIEIAKIRQEALEAAKAFVTPYDELKRSWEGIKPPMYEETAGFDRQAFDKNVMMFRQYCSDITQAVGQWFMSEKFMDDPYAAIWGESMGQLRTVQELIKSSNRNFNIYPGDESWASSLPYGAYLIKLWFELMDLNSGGIFGSYILERSGVKEPSEELRNLINLVSAS